MTESLDIIPPVIQKLLSDADRLPSLPSIVHELQRTLALPDVDMRKIAAVIEKDPGLSARVLKLANSAFFGFAGKVATVPLASSLLGVEAIDGLVTGMGVVGAVSDTPTGGFSAGAFWLHAITTGMCAQAMVGHFGWNLRGDVFTCGVLHDLGKIIVSQYLPLPYLKILELARAGTTYREAECKILGADHPRIGYWVAKKWQLPDVFAQCMLRHHDWPEHRDTMGDQRVAAVFLGNLVAHMTEYKRERGRFPALRPDMIQRIGLTQEFAEQAAGIAIDQAQHLLHELMPAKAAAEPEGGS